MHHSGSTLSQYLAKGEALMTDPCQDHPTPERKWKDIDGLFEVKAMGLPTRQRA